jgi:hypothetical protein
VWLGSAIRSRLPRQFTAARCPRGVRDVRVFLRRLLSWRVHYDAEPGAPRALARSGVAGWPLVVLTDEPRGGAQRDELPVDDVHAFEPAATSTPPSAGSCAITSRTRSRRHRRRMKPWYPKELSGRPARPPRS